MAGQDVDHLSVQKFGLPVVLTGHVTKWPEKKNAFSDHYVSRAQATFFTYVVAR